MSVNSVRRDSDLLTGTVQWQRHGYCTERNMQRGSQRECMRAGVRYEGEWQDGREHGVGALVEADGSTFYGFWQDGRLHGEGVRAAFPLLELNKCRLLGSSDNPKMPCQCPQAELQGFFTYNTTRGCPYYTPH